MDPGAHTQNMKMPNLGLGIQPNGPVQNHLETRRNILESYIMH